MSIKHHNLALPLMLASLSACATLGTNVAGDFSCRAPKGGCAPTGTIDAAATAPSPASNSEHTPLRARAGIVPGDISRTGERTLKIVFPAHIDSQGTLRDEAVAWAVVEQADWAAALRRSPVDSKHSVNNQLRQSLKQKQQSAGAPQSAPLSPDATASEPFLETDADRPFSDALLFPLVSPLVLPSTAREAIAGASAPVVEGFDMSSPLHVRTPRSSKDEVLQNYPTLEAIAAAKSRSKTDAGPLPKDPQ
jgi:conjugal transfer pilus assembly protein TraV